MARNPTSSVVLPIFCSSNILWPSEQKTATAPMSLKRHRTQSPNESNCSIRHRQSRQVKKSSWLCPIPQIVLFLKMTHYLPLSARITIFVSDSGRKLADRKEWTRGSLHCQLNKQYIVNLHKPKILLFQRKTIPLQWDFRHSKDGVIRSVQSPRPEPHHQVNIPCAFLRQIIGMPQGILLYF